MATRLRLSTTSLLCLPLLAPLAGAQKLPPQKSSAPSHVATVPGGMGSFLGGSDSCATPTPIAGAMMIPFDLTTATTGVEGQNEAPCLAFGTTGIDNDVWWAWTPSTTSVGRVTTCSLTGTDTKIAAYPGNGCPAPGSILGCNDDTCTLQSRIDFQVVAGTTYTIQLGTFPGAAASTGIVSFEENAPTNNLCNFPEVLPGEGSFPFDLTNASVGIEGQNESNCFAFNTTRITNDIWFTYIPNCSGDVTVTTCNTTGTDTRIAAYPGMGCPVDGTSLACNDDTCALQSEITWTAVAGSPYTIQLGTYPGAAAGTGLFDVSISCSGPSYPPACFGDGSGGPCACGNPGAMGEGCANSTGSGAVLAGSGIASVTGDTFNLSAAGTTNQPGIFFQGNQGLNPAPLFGDGFRCCGQNVVRVGTYLPSGNATDTATGNLISGFGPPVSGHPLNGNLMAGDSRCYQWWYRDPSGPCGSGFNLSNSVTAIWTP